MISFAVSSSSQEVGATPPANDAFRKPALLTGPAGATSGTNVGATVQAGERNHASIPGGKSVWYRWNATATSAVTFSTEGSDFDTLVAIYSGLILTDLIEVGANNDVSVGAGKWSSVSFIATAGVEYRIAVDGAQGAEGQIKLSWTSVPINDRFEQFQILGGFAGNVEGNTFGATAQPGEPSHAQQPPYHTVWFAWPALDSGLVQFTTQASSYDTILAVYGGEALNALELVAENDDAAPDGTSAVEFNAIAGSRYRIVIGSKVQNATGHYDLKWRLQLPPPVNDSFSGAIPIRGIAGQQYGTSIGATVEPNEPHPLPVQGGSSVWFAWTAPFTGEVIFETGESAFDTQLMVFRGDSLEALELVDAADDRPEGLDARVRFAVESGVTYKIALDGKQGSGDAYVLKWVNANANSSNNQFANANFIKGYSASTIGENYYATREEGEPLHAGDHGGRSVWYFWIAPANYRVAFSTSGSNFDTLLAAYVGTDFVTGLSEMASNDDDDDGTLTSSIEFDAIAGEKYLIAVDGATENDLRPAGVGEIELSWQPVDLHSVVFYPERGQVGSSVTLFGWDQKDITSVLFNDAEAQFTASTDGITALVPVDAVTGSISLMTSLGEVFTATKEFIVTPPSFPILNIRSGQDSTVRVAWPALFPGFKLQYLDILPAAQNWTDCIPPSQIGGEYVVEESLSTNARFYRLVEE